VQGGVNGKTPMKVSLKGRFAIFSFFKGRSVAIFANRCDHAERDVQPVSDFFMATHYWRG
jgi:hypothetical protein